METTAQISARAIKQVSDFIVRATGVKEPTEDNMRNALFLVNRSCQDCVGPFQLSGWHKKQGIHSFEALVCRWEGANQRYPALTLNLHFAIAPSGEVVIGTEEEMPLGEDYHINRVINDAACSTDGV